MVFTCPSPDGCGIVPVFFREQLVVPRAVIIFCTG